MEPNHSHKPKTPRATEKKLSALKAKHEKRKFKGTVTPDPSTGISLGEFTSFTEHLKHSKRIFALFGAGLSVSSGLVTYRGADRHWRGHEPAIFSDIEAFEKDPVTVWWYYSYRMMRAQIAAPNPAHYALAKLAESNPNFFAVKQNVDGLCRRAGFPESQIALVHGDLFSVKCSRYNSENEKCDYTSTATYPINQALTLPTDVDISDGNVPLPSLSPAELPHCPKCNSLLRPGVVFFGESIATATSQRIYEFTSSGPIDLMLVAGTSAVVLPAAMYIPIARNAGARVAFFNLEESAEEVGQILDGDWFFKGDAAVMVAEMLKGVVGNVPGMKAAIGEASKVEA